MLKHYKTMLQGMVAQSRHRHGDSAGDTKDLETMLQHANVMLEGTQNARGALVRIMRPRKTPVSRQRDSPLTQRMQCGRQAYVSDEDAEIKVTANCQKDAEEETVTGSKRKASGPKPQSASDDINQSTTSSSRTDPPVSTDKAPSERPNPFQGPITYQFRSSLSPPKHPAIEDAQSFTARLKRRKHDADRPTSSADTTTSTTTPASRPLRKARKASTRGANPASASTSAPTDSAPNDTPSNGTSTSEPNTQPHEIPSVADEITEYPEPEYYDLNAEMEEHQKATRWIRKRERGEIEKRKRESFESSEGVTLHGLASENKETTENQAVAYAPKNDRSGKKRKVARVEANGRSTSTASPSPSPAAHSANPIRATNENTSINPPPEEPKKASAAELAAMASSTAHKNTVPNEATKLKGPVKTKRTFSDRLSGIQGNKFNSKKVKLMGKKQGEPVAGIVGRTGGSSP
jgi:hypothetical protein